VIAVKGSLRRASPALDRAHRTLSPDPTHSFFKRGFFLAFVVQAYSSRFCRSFRNS